MLISSAKLRELYQRATFCSSFSKKKSDKLEIILLIPFMKVVEDMEEEQIEEGMEVEVKEGMAENQGEEGKEEEVEVV
ncbi:unnamed protein product [Strongylus vulgaris]|uniref:Uncharacterized protein n=1 Tax=Strongylus vulgaris TaxID=40348 RepID=A0A3P7J8K0_STRVU|nr:unnamed protein product [Strongylus vulgaris]